MAIIEGQIEPLKKLRKVLHQNGITRFNSIADINNFKKNYDSEKAQIPQLIESQLTNEIIQIESDLAEIKINYEALKTEVSNEIKLEIKDLEEKLASNTKANDESLLRKLLFYSKTKRLKNKLTNLNNNFEKTLIKKTKALEKNVSELKEKLDYYRHNKDTLISERCFKAEEKLDRVKEIIDSLYNLISGAIGENAVIKEIQKLPDNFHLFNDVFLEFEPPLYNKKEDDRIYSIQVDHLLVSEAGVFILETKNWSKRSIKNIDLRSPIQQVLRSSYAMFVLLNSRSRNNKISLKHHHWGNKQIPVRNLIVMINEKPKEEFKHVKVLSLNELNKYVRYFDPVFSSDEVESICDYLRARMS